MGSSSRKLDIASLLCLSLACLLHLQSSARGELQHRKEIALHSLKADSDHKAVVVQTQHNSSPRLSTKKESSADVESKSSLQIANEDDRINPNSKSHGFSENFRHLVNKRNAEEGHNFQPSGELKDDEKRRAFIGKRDDSQEEKRRAFIGKRDEMEKRRPFIGKREMVNGLDLEPLDSDSNEVWDDKIEKRRAFIGKRPSGATRSRTLSRDQLNILEYLAHQNRLSDKRRAFIGKRWALEEEKRRAFIGKRNYDKRRAFIGKRSDIEEQLNNIEFEQFGKRRAFIGKRDSIDSGNVNNEDDSYSSNFDKRRAFIGKRGDTQHLNPYQMKSLLEENENELEKRRAFIGK